MFKKNDTTTFIAFFTFKPITASAVILFPFISFQSFLSVREYLKKLQFPPWITISLHPPTPMAAGCLYPCWLLADLKTLPLFQHYLQSIRIFAEDTFCTRTNLCFLIQNLKRKCKKYICLF